FQADINDDGDIDILDAVRMINIILGNATAKPVAGPTGPVQLDLATPVVTADGQTAIPVFAQFDGSVAGLQLTFAYDPALVSIGTAIPSGVLDGMTIEQHANDGKLTLVIYSIDGRTFQASSIASILNLPVSFSGSDGGDVSLLGVVVADPQAESVPATLTNGTVKVSSNPGTFALQNNRPNPFNPSTQIAYDVPQQARITVSIFNVLGQEIVRLVDQVQSPGRYVVSWNGRNSDGLGVSSGVYMYRLSSSTGYSDTRRMTLLK
ncbi:MAG: T9SS type A sorting domain-containing protein, partial [Candidatus Latescibacteria bacterium]|nr:T9SS type A sorting domain-containing protein [Candidatus Latescibacterota bacterium]